MVVLMMAAAGCVAGEPPSTGDVLGPEEQRDRAWIALRDVHPLWGGRDVYVEGSGRVVVRDVPRGGPDERRIAASVPAEEARALLRRAVELDVLRVKLVDRPGVPDEGRPTLVAHGADGAEGRITKWANDKVAPFDELLTRLNQIGERAAKEGTASDAGRYDPGWRPFEAVALIVDCMSGRPNPSADLSLPADHEALKQRLADLPPGGPPEPPSNLGMRGFVLEPRGVPGLPARVHVHGGTVWTQEGEGWRAGKDVHGLEAWLTERARAIGLELPR